MATAARDGRRSPATRWSGRLRRLDGIYVEYSSSFLPSETDIAFLGLARMLGIPVLTYVRDAYQLALLPSTTTPPVAAAAVWARWRLPPGAPARSRRDLEPGGRLHRSVLRRGDPRRFVRIGPSCSRRAHRRRSRVERDPAALDPCWWWATPVCRRMASTGSLRQWTQARGRRRQGVGPDQPWRGPASTHPRRIPTGCGWRPARRPQRSARLLPAVLATVIPRPRNALRRSFPSRSSSTTTWHTGARCSSPTASSRQRVVPRSRSGSSLWGDGIDEIASGVHQLATASSRTAWIWRGRPMRPRPLGRRRGGAAPSAHSGT